MILTILLSCVCQLLILVRGSCFADRNGCHYFVGVYKPYYHNGSTYNGLHGLLWDGTASQPQLLAVAARDGIYIRNRMLVHIHSHSRSPDHVTCMHRRICL